MPFKLKLKKSRHYSVVSKTLFVISVELLDGTNIECTLSSESPGQHCLDVVCQKLGLNQPKFFGLQYVSRVRDQLCWLELDRPIKRQLDKHARGLSVHLRVMYYVVSGVRLFDDEVTRNHYFLQLKMDVIEGRISCTPQQAVELASYCMQAEFGNFDAERHTAHYLKDFQLFPKCFTDPVFLESLTDAASRQHAALHNIPQGTAEEYYICACQRLDGYGQEVFSVKDKSGEAALVGVSLTGVTVSYPGGHEGRSYGWVDISNVINHKRDFTVESSVGSEKAEFHFPDAESAKNAWRFCVLQHMFFRQYESNNSTEGSNSISEKTPNFQQQDNSKLYRQAVVDSSYEDITGYALTSQQRAQSTSCLDLNTPTDIDKLRSLLPSYRPAPDYETAVREKYRSSEVLEMRGVLYSSQPEIHQRFPDVIHNNVESMKNFGYNSNNYTDGNVNINYASGENANVNITESLRLLHLSKPPPPYPSNRLSSNSTPDLAGLSQLAKPQTGFVNSLVSGSSPDLVSTGNLYLYANNHHVHRSQSYLPPQHGTYENLASIFNNNMLGRPQAAVIVENPNITKHIKKVYDERGNIIYCMPANMKQILEDNQLQSTGFVVTRNQNEDSNYNKRNLQETEPIYENIPLPWQQHEGEPMRARTQSVQSAPPEVTAKNEILYANVAAEQTAAMARTDTFIINKESAEKNKNSSLNSSTASSSRDFNESTLANNKNSSLNSSSASSCAFVDPNSKNSRVFNETTTSDASSAASSSSNKKKKRWVLLMGRSKSSEKVKSATLGREKEKKDKSQSNNRHRWSTGLPRYNPLPPSITKEAMCQLLENKLGDSQLFFEFDKIPKKKQNCEFTTASLPENAVFNMFKDVLPYEDNRLRLTTSRDNKYGYINASHITATVGSKQRFYIAAQGPTRLTLPYFWQSVWEAEVYLLVQLTDPKEDLNYLPDAGGRSVDVGQDYQVLWEFSQKTGHCVTSKVRLCHVTSRRYRTLWHLHYTDWGEQGCPQQVAHFLGFLEELQSVQQHSMAEIPPGHNKNPPVLVHCTAGVGRTGLAIACDLLLYTVDHNQEVDIPRLVGQLRHQRPYMVQTIAQYRFVYSLLIHYLKQTRLI